MAKDIKRTNKLSKKSNEQLQVEKFTIDEVRDFLAKESYYEGHPKHLLEKMAVALPEVLGGKNKQEFGDLLQKASQIMNLENHELLYRSTTESYRSFSIEFANLLTKEYLCTEPSEKALVEVITSAYIRSLQYTEMMSVNTSGEKTLSSERNGFYTFLSREIDRAQRQFITSLQTLKQLKSPSLPVTIKTTTAFIAQNQQINASEKPDDNEINKPK